MRLPPPLHRWNVSVQEAKSLQIQLYKKLIFKPLPPRIKIVAGVDMAISKERGLFFSAVTLMSFPECKVLEVKGATVPYAYPYIPGLLSFREGPAILAAFEKLDRRPDVVVFDGQGIAHPQRFGLAAHLGLWLQLPSIGCAKSRLTGVCLEPGREKGSFEYLYAEGEIIGMSLRTRSGVKPLFVSSGHLSDLASARILALECAVKYRLPEPVRQAHLQAEKMKCDFMERK